MRDIVLGPIGPSHHVIFLDGDSAVSLPSNLGNSPPQPAGSTYLIVDNLSLGQRVTITAPLANGGNTTVVNDSLGSGQSGWALRFTLIGSFYVIG